MARKNKLEKADLKVAEAAAPLRAKGAVKVAGAISELADQPPLITICAATFAAGLLAGNRRLASAGGRMLAAELLATAMKSAVKHRIDRTRPRIVADGGGYALRRGASHDSGLNSFPSGHTAGAVAVTRALAREYPQTQAAGMAAAALVAGIQIPRSQHYMSDLAAGAAIGIAAEAAVHAAERLLAWSLAPPDAPKPE